MDSEVKHAKPTPKVVRQVIGLAGNQCAFEGCPLPIVDRDHGVIVGKVAHIKARSSKGPRFDKFQSEADNRSVFNLLALCGPVIMTTGCVVD